MNSSQKQNKSCLLLYKKTNPPLCRTIAKNMNKKTKRQKKPPNHRKRKKPWTSPTPFSCRRITHERPFRAFLIQLSTGPSAIPRRCCCLWRRHLHLSEGRAVRVHDSAVLGRDASEGFGHHAAVAREAAVGHAGRAGLHA